jgi:hypothetical protein
LCIPISIDEISFCGMLVAAPLLPSLGPLAALLLIEGFLVIASLIAQFATAIPWEAA